MVSVNAFRRLFWIFDFTIIVLAFLVAYVAVPYLHLLFIAGGPLRTPWIETIFLPSNGGTLLPIRDILWILPITAPITVVVLGFCGNHEPLLEQSRTRIIIGGLVSPFVGISLTLIILFALKITDWSRLYIFSFLGFSGLGLLGYRLILKRYFWLRQQSGRYVVNVLIIGACSGIDWMANYIADHFSPMTYRLFGYFTICKDDPLPVFNRVPFPHLGQMAQLGDLLIHKPIHEVVLVYPITGGDWVNDVIRECEYFQVTLHIIPESLLQGKVLDLQLIYRHEALQLPAITLRPRHWNSEAIFVKRLFDILASAILLILLIPLFIMVAIAIKITTPSLPVFHKMHWVGYKGIPFSGYKFTTMVADAEAQRIHLMKQNEMIGPAFKIKKDPRITPLGQFLRKFSINELPQLWNVLKGDMSLVGPRPGQPHELAEYDHWQKRRLSIRPGITCLWQVSGRNRINDFNDWVKLDYEYIDNWSLWLDFKILFRTFWVVFAGTGE